MTVFETERLTAREWRVDDAAAAYEIYRDPDVVRFLGTTPQPVASVAEQRQRVERWIGVTESLRGTGYGQWALETHDGTLVGMALLKPLPDAAEVEVGWHLGKPFWGSGYATEGARGAIAHGFTVCGLNVIYAVVVAENEASAAVAGRLGMHHEGSTDRYYDRRLELYSIRP
ncbi:MAG TPA: GNAT family N-acetyltransferase [Mycobacteriales bacterium]|nr:GNAT family N-acetyltransferase [Mycobacteriales bacterium]